MKHLFFVAAFLFTFHFSFGQVQSNYTDNAALISKEYKYDIHYLTVNSIPNTDPDYTIDVPKHRTEAITKALTAIFNTESKLKADSVFDKYCVHEYYAKRNSIEIILDTNSSWANNWINGITETGNDTLNNLLKRYGYTVSDAYNIELVSDQLINRFALCDSLVKFKGIKSAVPSGVIHFGFTTESIYYDLKNNITTVGFIMPWEVGRYNTHHWRYTIDENFIVTLVLDTVYFLIIEPDKPYPTPKNCNISAQIIKQDLAIYPNPIISQAIIRTTEEGNIQLYTLSGQRLKNYISYKGYTSIDLSNLASGIYIVQHRTISGKTEFQKIFKE